MLHKSFALIRENLASQLGPHSSGLRKTNLDPCANPWKWLLLLTQLKLPFQKELKANKRSQAHQTFIAAYAISYPSMCSVASSVIQQPGQSVVVGVTLQRIGQAYVDHTLGFRLRRLNMCRHDLNAILGFVLVHLITELNIQGAQFMCPKENSVPQCGVN